jgi:hypothetical protein
MKRISGIMILLLFVLNVSGQKSVDSLFERYSGNDGFVSVSFSGDILNFFRSEDDCRDKHWPKNVTEVHILAQDDKGMKVENFFDLAKKELDTREYDEYMSVRESDQDIKMYVRAKGRVINEFLLIGGGEDNFIIQIKGNITFGEAEDFSAEVRKNHRNDLFSSIN